MNKSASTILTASLAIFSMFFGAGNLIFPLATGYCSGQNFWWGLSGFIATAVLLPLIGLVGIILFNGDYDDFFGRLGKIPGFLLTAFCMIVIGPLIAMPRIITLTEGFLKPFIIDMPLALFSTLFCALTFIAIYKESKIMNILAYVISPALLGSLGVIIIKGMMHPTPFLPNSAPALETFWRQALVGYGTLDLLGALFFGSIALTLLKKSLTDHDNFNMKKLVAVTIKSGFIACSLIGILYVGLAFLGAYYGPLFGNQGLNPAQMFIAVCIKIMGSQGGFIIALAASLACYSTLMALAVVLAEFIQTRLTHHLLSYTQALVLVLGLTGIVSCNGLTAIMSFSAPIMNTLYPVVITLTLCNVAYKLCGFKWVKIPVLATLLASLYLNFF